MSKNIKSVYLQLTRLKNLKLLSSIFILLDIKVIKIKYKKIGLEKTGLK
jgi:hypothetical protein